MMKIDYNVTGAEKKKLVQAISKATGYEAKYLKLPTLGHQVGPYFISRDGVVEVDENEPTLDAAINGAVAAGFIGTIEADPGDEELMEVESSPVEEEDEPLMGSISVTKEGMTPAMIENLQKIIIGKASLIKQAFGIETLPVLEEHDKITFEWFPNMDPSNGPAYCEFISALRKMAMEAKRVTMSDSEVENPKYAWRCFLLRLGFIGPEYKNTRKILMKNFTGSSAFKHKKEACND